MDLLYLRLCAIILVDTLSWWLRAEISFFCCVLRAAARPQVHLLPEDVFGAHTSPPPPSLHSSRAPARACTCCPLCKAAANFNGSLNGFEWKYARIITVSLVIRDSNKYYIIKQVGQCFNVLAQFLLKFPFRMQK